MGALIREKTNYYKHKTTLLKVLVITIISGLASGLCNRIWRL